MKTKEITVTLIESPHQGGYRIHELIEIDGLPANIKAKLVIELPEDKYEITESQLDEHHLRYVTDPTYHTTDLFKVIKKIK